MDIYVWFVYLLIVVVFSLVFGLGMVNLISNGLSYGICYLLGVIIGL